MFSDDWSRQRRRVRRLHRLVNQKQIEEKDLRRAFKDRAMELLGRFESMLLIGTVGVVWADRIRNTEADAPRRPILELIGATLVVFRWRDLLRYFNAGRAPK